MLKGSGAVYPNVMRGNSPTRFESAPTPAPGPAGLAVAYLLVFMVPVALWAASEPLLVGTLAAGAVAAVAAQVGLAYVVRRLGSERRRRVCVPVTGMCVEF